MVIFAIGLAADMTLGNDLLSIRLALRGDIELFVRERMVNMDDFWKPDGIGLNSLI